MYVYACVRPQVYGDPPLHLASRELSSLAKRSRWGEAVVVRPPPSPIPRLDTFAKRERCNNLQLVRSISFHQFPTFLTFSSFSLSTP